MNQEQDVILEWHPKRVLIVLRFVYTCILLFLTFKTTLISVIFCASVPFVFVSNFSHGRFPIA